MTDDIFNASSDFQDNVLDDDSELDIGTLGAEDDDPDAVEEDSYDDQDDL